MRKITAIILLTLAGCCSHEDEVERSRSVWSDDIEIGGTHWEGWVPVDPNEPYIIFPKGE